MDETICWASALDCHGEGRQDELGTHVVGESPADDTPAEEVDNDGEVEPASPGPDIRDVSSPNLV